MKTLEQLTKHKAGGVTLLSDTLDLSLQLIEASKQLGSATNSSFIHVYKQEARKCVLLLRLPKNSGGDIVLKGYPLRNFSDRLKHRRFGWLEACNILKAQNLGLPVPELMGYIEHRKFGMVIANGALIQNLPEHKTLMEMAHATDVFYTINRAIPVIHLFYLKGINYIDMSPHNLMSDGSDSPPITIDWQNCAFIEPKNPRQLILHASQFLRYLNEDFPESDWTQWITDIYNKCLPDIPFAIFLKFVYYFANSRRPKKSFRYALDFKLDSPPTFS